MSHQSGIQASKELIERFAQAIASDNDRIIRVSIKNESLVEDGVVPVKDNWETDFSLVEGLLEERTPSYILYRLDSKNSSDDHEWLFMAYVPDRASVRDKMLYASTRATLTKELGNARFTDALYGTTREELTLKGYKDHLRHLKAAAPLTEAEEQMEQLRVTEAATSVGNGSRRNHMAALGFPIEDAAQDALKQLQSEGHKDNCVILRLNIKEEKVELDTVQTVTVSNLATTIPKDLPRYTFYSYKKEDSTEAIVFIYTCPSVANVREKMIYSSARETLLNTVSNMGLVVAKKMETDDVSELTTKEISDLFPPEEKSSTAGIRPAAFKRPPLPGRGRARPTNRTAQLE
ncbi:twinfilin-2-like protein [Syncephalis fuscata]|nr:twinfilin-2-like protein [Syncephalis fuscata]